MQRGYSTCGLTAQGAFPLIFDLKWVWMESIFAILGGGLMVTVSLLFTVLFDVTPPADR